MKIEKAISEFGATKLARLLDLPKTTVESWKTRGVPDRWKPIVADTISNDLRRMLENLSGYGSKRNSL